MNADLRSLRERQLATLEARDFKDESCLATIELIKQQLGDAGAIAAAAALTGAEREELEQLRAEVVNLRQLHHGGGVHRDEMAKDLDQVRVALEAEQLAHSQTREQLAAAIVKPAPAKAVAPAKRKR